MEKKLKKVYLTYYNLLIAHDLWQRHYQILSIILSIINTVMKMKNVKLVELNISTGTVFLNT